MTIPTRPAPPPPKREEGMQNHIKNLPSHNKLAVSSTILNKNANKKPPRPPPPKVIPPESSKVSGSRKTTSVFSSIFGVSKNNSEVNKNLRQEMLCPPKIPPPSSTSRNQQKSMTNDVQLINFDLEIENSALNEKSSTSSDSVSMDSYCSSNSSPNNFSLGSGVTSQTESGFEDDFNAFKSSPSSEMLRTEASTPSDPFDCVENLPIFTKATNVQNHSNIRNIKPPICPKPSIIGSSNFFTSSNKNVPSANGVDESLCNGKNLIKPSSVAIPTIIKPQGKGKVTPTLLKSNEEVTTSTSVFQEFREGFLEDLPSPPMPKIPPPPPPILDSNDEQEETCSYAIVLYDYTSDVVEDLNLKRNEKIYLLKQMNDEWMYGRDKRGCEGIFPINYVDIRVPLNADETTDETASSSTSYSASENSSAGNNRVRVLYNFNAEAHGDLTIKENEIINVLYEINHEWLYGSNIRGDYGQFPAQFIENVPQNLPRMTN